MDITKYAYNESKSPVFGTLLQASITIIWYGLCTTIIYIDNLELIPE